MSNCIPTPKGEGQWEFLWDLKGCRDDKTLMKNGVSIEEVHKRCWNVTMDCCASDERIAYYEGKQDAFEMKFPCTKTQKQAICNMLRRDTNWLAGKGLMDYSLIIGRMRVTSKDDLPHECPKGADSTDMQPFMSTSSDGECYAYYLGIIDFLQEWTGGKKAAHVIKCACAPAPIATINPEAYADQFYEYFENKFIDTADPVDVEVHDLGYESADDGASHLGDPAISSGFKDEIRSHESASRHDDTEDNPLNGPPSESRPKLRRDANSHLFMGSVQERFERACDWVKHWKNSTKLTPDEKCQAFKYIQQAQKGDCNVEIEEYMDIALGQEKWTAWNSVKGVSKEEAMKLYADEIEAQRNRYEKLGAFQGETVQERFEIASQFMDGWKPQSEGGEEVQTIEERLVGYKFRKQAMTDFHEDNEEWADIPLGHEKFSAWKTVQGMKSETAMLKYVDHVERQRARYGD